MEEGGGSSRSGLIREVFRENFEREEERLVSELKSGRFKTIAFDTEYPGTIKNTAQFAGEEERYGDMKFNVENTNLIQVGFTVFNPMTARIAGVWQFNISGFDPRRDKHSEEAIKMLRRSGIDLKENNTKGVGIEQFAGMMIRIRQECKVEWVTFHGLYDVGYLLAAVLGELKLKLPKDVRGFGTMAGELFSSGIFDLKCMAGERSWMGLEKLAAALGTVREEGCAHQAGSDSLLTAKAFIRAFHSSSLVRNVENYRMRLFGISVPIMSDHHRLILSRLHRPQLAPRTCYTIVVPRYTHIAISRYLC